MIVGYKTNGPALVPLMNLLDGQLMTAPEVADHLRYSQERLAHLRKDGGGPPFLKLPTGGVRYQLAEVMAWQASAETGPLTMDRVALAIAACVGVPAEQRAAMIQHLEKAFVPMQGDQVRASPGKTGRSTQEAPGLAVSRLHREPRSRNRSCRP
jgi:hypothetical protein